jgi:hypothetical protein
MARAERPDAGRTAARLRSGEAPRPHGRSGGRRCGSCDQGPHPPSPRSAISAAAHPHDRAVRDHADQRRWRLKQATPPSRMRPHGARQPRPPPRARPNNSIHKRCATLAGSGPTCCESGRGRHRHGRHRATEPCPARRSHLKPSDEPALAVARAVPIGSQPFGPPPRAPPNWLMRFKNIAVSGCRGAVFLRASRRPLARPRSAARGGSRVERSAHRRNFLPACASQTTRRSGAGGLMRKTGAAPHRCRHCRPDRLVPRPTALTCRVSAAPGRGVDRQTRPQTDGGP